MATRRVFPAGWAWPATGRATRPATSAMAITGAFTRVRSTSPDGLQSSQKVPYVPPVDHLREVPADEPVHANVSGEQLLQGGDIGRRDQIRIVDESPPFGAPCSPVEPVKDEPFLGQRGT